MLSWALRYQKLGLSVIPLRPKGKEPLIKWEEFQTRKASKEEIRSWWKKWPEANIGTVTGVVSGIVVVDLDGKEGLQEAQRLNLTSTLVSISGDGKHLWMKHPGGVVENAVRKYPGIDVRGDKGYIVAPPSVHESGKRYRFVNALRLETLPVFPLNLFVSVVDKKEFNESGWIAEALKGMRDGNIDNTLVSVLGRLRHDGWSAVDSQALLEPHVKRVGAEDGHLEAKIENVWSRYSSCQDNSSENDSFIVHSPTRSESIKRFEECLLGQTINAGVSLKTCFPKLDALFENGLKSERLFTIAALTGVGKTNFGIALSANLCQQSKKVLYFSTEFQYQKVWTRYIATLKNPERFREHAFYVVDSFRPNLEQVEEAIRKVQPDIFIFDFIQQIGKEKEVLTQFMQGCQFLQRKYDTQGIILAQLNRTADFVENGKTIEPRLSMIEGSATLEQASSRVLLLQEVKVTPEMNEINGYLAKNDSGDRGLIHFALMKQPYKMVEL